MQRFRKDGGVYVEEDDERWRCVTSAANDGVLWHTYTEEEWVAENIDFCIGWLEDLPSLFPFFGASDDPAVRGLTILGRPPSGVVEYEHEGKMYYFWYYDGSLDFGLYLVERGFDFGDFTIGGLVEALEVEVPR